VWTHLRKAPVPEASRDAAQLRHLAPGGWGRHPVGATAAGHATIAQTSDTYGHLESDRHEERVNLDEVLTPRRRPAASIYVPPSPPEPRLDTQLLRIIEGEIVAEGKGFDQQSPKNPNYLGDSTPHDPASEGTSRPPASHPEGEAPSS